MTYLSLASPLAEPLTLAEVKAHLRIDGSTDDDYLAGLVRVARDHLERATGLCLIRRRLRLALESVCEDGVIQILKGPVQSLEKMTLYDGAGSPSDYPVRGLSFDRDGPPTRLVLPPGFDGARARNGLEIDFTAGFGDAGTDVPDSLRRALLLHVAVMFDYRGAVTIEDQPAALPDGYGRLIQPFLATGL